ncbi:PREDICTED: dormancy-associated protein 1-like isoform X2 [Tarenaya hassleriana]|uniref:dormancy-associated protein 1-like isoform X2 n=1 Tax=Tarenaya hassleriana TaxID=28532 RepID=UPI00053C8443|nr:PREDICTED: dormancy-associated protein 1-like isoform X2 [Tarenaya hassleriana]
MVLLEKLWDDVVAGPQPARGLGKLRKISTDLSSDAKRGSSGLATIPGSPATPTTPMSPGSGRAKDNVWRSVFNPGSNLNTKSIGNAVFDKPTHSNSPTVYDWLYSGGSRSQHR